ncbi:MAG: type VI secretion system tube protein Hcp [Verrucomicrobiales bacterium]
MKTISTKNRRFSLIIKSFLFGAVVLLTFQFSADAAVFAKFDGIDGESDSAEPCRKCWIDILDFEWGGSQSSQAKNAKAQFDKIVLTLAFNRISPKLMEACSDGSVIPSVNVAIEHADEAARTTYLTYELKNVRVTSFALATADDGTTAIQLSLSYQFLAQTYMDEDGNETTLTVDTKAGRAKLDESAASSTGR